MCVNSFLCLCFSAFDGFSDGYQGSSASYDARVYYPFRYVYVTAHIYIIYIYIVVDIGCASEHFRVEAQILQHATTRCKCIMDVNIGAHTHVYIYIYILIHTCVSIRACASAHAGVLQPSPSWILPYNSKCPWYLFGGA